MGLSSLLGPSVVAGTLIGIGVLYFIWVWASGGNRDTRESKEILVDLLSLPAGGFALVVGVLNLLYHGVPEAFSDGMVIAGGVGLLARSLHNVPWSALLALIAGTAAGLAVWVFGPSWLPGYVAAAVGFFVFLIIYLPLHAASAVFEVIGFFLKARILLALFGLALLAEGIAVAVGTSLWVLL